MGRIRTIKPEFFTDEDLYDAEAEAKLPLRLAFAGLWTQSDREGRFRWAPRALKMAILPYDRVDFAAILDALSAGGFVIKYGVAHDVSRVTDASLAEDEMDVYGWIPTWNAHQAINNRETDSILPGVEGAIVLSRGRKKRLWLLASRVPDASATRHEGKGREGKGREGKGKDKSAASPELIGPEFPLNDGSLWRCPKEFAEKLAKVYPAVQLLAELDGAALWAEANPTNRKTRGGMTRFLHNWFKRCQDRGGSLPPRRNGNKYEL